MNLEQLQRLVTGAGAAQRAVDELGAGRPLPTLAAQQHPLFVPGNPAPQGSHRAYVVGGHAKVTDDNPATRPYRALLADHVQQFIRLSGVPGIVFPVEPVALQLVFVMKRTAAERKGTPRPHTRKPDVDKLTRAVLDAMAGLLFTQDQQVTSVQARKMTALLGETPGTYLSWKADN